MMLISEDADKQHQTQAPSVTPPFRDRIKANFDTSIREFVGTGLGVIFKNHFGNSMAAGAHFIPSSFEPTIAEAMAFRWCISMARDLGFQEVEFEIDCLNLFQAWKRNDPFSNYLDSIVQDCKSLSLAFRSCVLLNCRKTANAVADHIAHLAFDYQDHVWVELDPPGTTNLLRQEALFYTGNEVSTF
ncbi:uncharacterized protein LOC130748596 [Lotus japonicus]|uniref:uncharacterized protein LOC130748596 n=1 Tax=Lotus japonicus TaxID=34305 RepID=UPI00258CA834|nr:uncharacterized protein LOC130748596 [Lotus japonicus]